MGLQIIDGWMEWTEYLKVQSGKESQSKRFLPADTVEHPESDTVCPPCPLSERCDCWRCRWRRTSIQWGPGAASAHLSETKLHYSHFIKNKHWLSCYLLNRDIVNSQTYPWKCLRFAWSGGLLFASVCTALTNSHSAGGNLSASALPPQCPSPPLPSSQLLSVSSLTHCLLGRNPQPVPSPALLGCYKRGTTECHLSGSGSTRVPPSPLSSGLARFLSICGFRFINLLLPVDLISTSIVAHDVKSLSDWAQPTGRIVHRQEWAPDAARTSHRPEISTRVSPQITPHVWPLMRSLSLLVSTAYTAFTDPWLCPGVIKLIVDSLDA